MHFRNTSPKTARKSLIGLVAVAAAAGVVAMPASANAADKDQSRHEAHVAHAAHQAHVAHLAHKAHLAHIAHVTHVANTKGETQASARKAQPRPAQTGKPASSRPAANKPAARTSLSAHQKHVIAKANAEARAKAAKAAKSAQAASRSQHRAPVANTSPQSYSGSPQAIARQIVPAAQFQAFSNIIERESGWNPRASNPSSGAYGLAQALPGSKMASAGADWQTNPATQIKWALNYMNERYGSPNGAWSFWQSHNWY